MGFHHLIFIGFESFKSTPPNANFIFSKNAFIVIVNFNYAVPFVLFTLVIYVPACNLTIQFTP